MKIVAGMGSVNDYETLVKAGADEVFCGFVPLEWNMRYMNNLPLNRREVMFYHVQIASLEEMRILKQMVDKYKVPVTITLNALFYTEEQLPLITKIINDLVQIGFYNFIIADMGLILYLLKNSNFIFQKNEVCCNIHVSGELGEWNQNTIEMLLKENEAYPDSKVRISRIIFHRKNTVEDMKASTELFNEKLDFEAFALNEMCHFTGGFCNSLHCDEMCHMCQVPYEVVPLKHGGRKLEIDREDVDSDSFGTTGCGLCALWKLREAGVGYLKVVGRGKSPDEMARDIQVMRTALRLLEQEVCEIDYIKRVQIDLLDGKCARSCYYY